MIQLEITIMQFATHNWLRGSMYSENNCKLPNESSRVLDLVDAVSNSRMYYFTIYEWGW